MIIDSPVPYFYKKSQHEYLMLYVKSNTTIIGVDIILKLLSKR